MYTYKGGMYIFSQTKLLKFDLKNTEIKNFIITIVNKKGLAKLFSKMKNRQTVLEDMIFILGPRCASPDRACTIRHTLPIGTTIVI